MEKHIVCQKEIFVKKHFSSNNLMPIDVAIRLLDLIKKDMAKGGGVKCGVQHVAIS